jgi:hypothetical protein
MQGHTAYEAHTTQRKKEAEIIRHFLPKPHSSLTCLNRGVICFTLSYIDREYPDVIATEAYQDL